MFIKCQVFCQYHLLIKYYIYSIIMTLEQPSLHKQDKPMKVHLARLFKANICLIIYYLSDNLLSFFILAASTALFLPSSDQNSRNEERINRFMKPIIQVSSTINKGYNTYISYPLINKILFLLILKVVIDFLWLTPTWLVILFLTQVLAMWSLLKQIGVVGLVHSFIDEAIISLDKLRNLLPKYGN